MRLTVFVALLMIPSSAALADWYTHPKIVGGVPWNGGIESAVEGEYLTQTTNAEDFALIEQKWDLPIIDIDYLGMPGEYGFYTTAPVSEVASWQSYPDFQYIEPNIVIPPIEPIGGIPPLDAIGYLPIGDDPITLGPVNLVDNSIPEPSACAIVIGSISFLIHRRPRRANEKRAGAGI